MQEPDAILAQIKTKRRMVDPNELYLGKLRKLHAKWLAEGPEEQASVGGGGSGAGAGGDSTRSVCAFGGDTLRCSHPDTASGRPTLGTAL